MATRVGIELSPSACRIIVIDGGLPWVRRAPETRVLSFDVLPRSELESHASLRALRRRPAAAVVWGVPNDHRQVVVASRSYDSMRREALTALAGAGIETRAVLSDIAPATAAADREVRRPVVVALASSAPIRDALAPLHNAGIDVRSVLTPAAALASLARARRTLALPDSIEAYVAVDEIATCIALVRNGALITARELSWGYLEDVHRGTLRRLDEVGDRLSAELTEFVAAVGASPSAIGQVCVCGGLPELRSMTVRMTGSLDVEVEALDSLYGINPRPLREREDEFRERGAEMRVAWAAAAVWPPALDLLHARNRRATRTALSRAAIVAGAAAGLGLGWQIQQSTWWRSAALRPPPSTVLSVRPMPPPGQTARATSPPAVAAPKPMTPAPPPAQAPPSIAAPTPPASTPPPAKPAGSPAPVSPSTAVGREPERVQPSPRPEPRPRRAPAETPLSFDASLGSILYSPDRKLAIVDGRIVGVGDEVRGARVTEIVPNAVLLRDGQGRLFRLPLAGAR